mmetsp:Transcript_25543/g.60700  ORF Transcript_25543/g.60700 Transcript_25543/m.60700 type:complete len:211 (-) Transcript_25543:63-695(-)
MASGLYIGALSGQRERRGCRSEFPAVFSDSSSGRPPFLRWAWTNWAGFPECGRQKGAARQCCGSQHAGSSAVGQDDADARAQAGVHARQSQAVQDHARQRGGRWPPEAARAPAAQVACPRGYQQPGCGRVRHDVLRPGHADSTRRPRGAARLHQAMMMMMMMRKGVTRVFEERKKNTQALMRVCVKRRRQNNLNWQMCVLWPRMLLCLCA